MSTSIDEVDALEVFGCMSDVQANTLEEFGRLINSVHPPAGQHCIQISINRPQAEVIYRLSANRISPGEHITFCFNGIPVSTRNLITKGEHKGCMALHYEQDKA